MTRSDDSTRARALTAAFAALVLYLETEISNAEIERANLIRFQDTLVKIPSRMRRHAEEERTARTISRVFGRVDALRDALRTARAHLDAVENAPPTEPPPPPRNHGADEGREDERAANAFDPRAPYLRHFRGQIEKHAPDRLRAFDRHQRVADQILDAIEAGESPDSVIAESLFAAAIAAKLAQSHRLSDLMLEALQSVGHMSFPDVEEVADPETNKGDALQIVPLRGRVHPRVGLSFTSAFPHTVSVERLTVDESVAPWFVIAHVHIAGSSTLLGRPAYSERTPYGPIGAEAFVGIERPNLGPFGPVVIEPGDTVVVTVENTDTEPREFRGYLTVSRVAVRS